MSATTAPAKESSAVSQATTVANTRLQSQQQPKQPTESADSALKSFLSGGVGGVCVVLVGHPLDLIKVRMQTSSGGSMVGIFLNTWRTGGIGGLYRGVTAPLVAVTPMFAVSFWGYDMGKRVVGYFDDKTIAPTSSTTLSLSQKTVAGGLSAIPTTALMAPSERIKCLMQTTTNYKSMSDCAMSLYRTGGISSVYKGTMLTLCRDIPGSMAWFGTYEAVKLYLTERQGIADPSELSPFAVLTAGGFAGMACWTVGIPADVLKSRFQSAPEGTYRNAYHVLRHLLQTEGPSALFMGIQPALVRAFPANAACFFGMEVSRKLLSFLD